MCRVSGFVPKSGRHFGEKTVLTRKQNELLLFINKRLNEAGISPSFDEMKDALGLKSKSGIHRLITGLEERGFIRRLPHRARALEVLKLPEGAESGAGRQRGSERAKFQPNVIKGDFSGTLVGREVNHDVEAIELPLYGRIAAGTPIEALRDNSAMINVPSTMLPPGDHYALEVAGDSMVEAGILDGDTVIINRCDMADSGSIVVALIDEHEVTLKRLRRQGQTVAPEPATPALDSPTPTAGRGRTQR